MRRRKWAPRSPALLLFLATVSTSALAGVASAEGDPDAAMAVVERVQPGGCPVTGSLRMRATGSTDRFVSLRGCREQTVVDAPQLVPPRSAPVIIPGAAEKAPVADDADGNDHQPAERARDRRSADGGMLADMLLPASLTGEDALLTPAMAMPALAPLVAFVRIAPVQPEVTAETLATIARLQFATAGSAASPVADAILALAPRSYATRFDQLIADAARRHAIDPLLLHAVIRQESHYGAHAVSRAGAVGLMQIMPATGARFGRAHGALFDPACNVDVGARLLRTLHARYQGDLELMLAAYNAGEGAVSRYGNRVPPFRETRDYVQRVKTHYTTLASENGLAGLAL